MLKGYKYDFEGLKSLILRSRQSSGIYCKQTSDGQARHIIIANHKLSNNQSQPQSKSEINSDQEIRKEKNKQRKPPTANLERKKRRKNKKTKQGTEKQQIQKRNQDEQKESEYSFGKKQEKHLQNFGDKPKKQLNEKILQKGKEAKSAQVLDFSFDGLGKKQINQNQLKQEPKVEKVQLRKPIPTMEIINVTNMSRDGMYALKSLIFSQVNVMSNISMKQWYQIGVPKFLRRSLRHLDINPQILDLSMDEAIQIFKYDIETTKTQKLLFKKQQILLKLIEYDKKFKKRFLLKPNDEQKKAIQILYQYYNMVKQFIKNYKKQLNFYLKESKNRIAELAALIQQEYPDENQVRRVLEIEQKIRKVRQKIRKKILLSEDEKIYEKYLQQLQIFKKIKTQFKDLIPPKHPQQRVSTEKILE